MLISQNFDAGNIHILKADSPDNIRLEIKKDNQSDFYQWFYFKVSNVAQTPLNLSIDNAGGAAYAAGWDDYRVCASYDRESWFRIPTSRQDDSLTWQFTPDQNAVYFAYFAPYSMERHADLIAQAAQHPLVRHEVLGHTLDGQDMDMLEIGHGSEGRKKIWLIARQHPGESMAEWWMEGAIDRLLDESDPVARDLLDKAQFYIIPNMNPDGSRRGHLRTNAAGANLNREWNCATLDRSPEVVHALKKMDEVGMDFNLDVHGDEALPYNFLAGYEGIPDLSHDHLEKFTDYRSILANISPDFQETHGYPTCPAGKGDLSMATNYLAHHFQCMAATLEMPFKDNADLPDPEYGWSPDRCRHLARDCLAALSLMLRKI